jgi:glycine/D-amino acid oxidase-like deaminating enzyme
MSAELAEAGLSVVLAEKRSKLGSGPSTNNEGMLHRGTYHAAAIRDRIQAIEVARRCAEGYKRILKIAPESIEDTFDRCFALFRADADINEICSRWDEAGVPYSPVSKQQYSVLEPGTDLSGIAEVFEVQDRSINPRALYRNMLRRAEELGVVILPQAEVTQVQPEQNRIYLRVGGFTEPIAIEAQACVCTAGSGIRDFFARALETDIPMRYWKSHLLDTARVCRHNMFVTYPGGITLMQHGAWSIAGLNADAIPIPEPDSKVVPESADALREGLRQFFPRFDSSTSIPRACIKVDVGGALSASQTGQLKLNCAYGEPVNGHFWVIPGKMTEVPCVAEALVQLLRERLAGNVLPPVLNRLVPQSTIQIADRPIDEYGPPTYAVPASGSRVA